MQPFIRKWKPTSRSSLAWHCSSTNKPWCLTKPHSTPRVCPAIRQCHQLHWMVLLLAHRSHLPGIARPMASPRRDLRAASHPKRLDRRRLYPRIVRDCTLGYDSRSYRARRSPQRNVSSLRHAYRNSLSRRTNQRLAIPVNPDNHRRRGRDKDFMKRRGMAWGGTSLKRSPSHGPPLQETFVWRLVVAAHAATTNRISGGRHSNSRQTLP